VVAKSELAGGRTDGDKNNALPAGVRTSASPSATDDAQVGQTTLRLASRRLIPFLFILYVTSFLDRVNVGFAALQMNRDLGFGPAVYGFGAGIFFIGYALFEVPSNLILARTGARIWIARIMITWGFIAAGMMFVHGPLAFYLMRFLLGVAEAGFFPGIIYYLSLWFPAVVRARMIARFMIAIPVSAVIGGPLSGALLGLSGNLGLAGWQWLFLLEGLPAVALGIAVFFYLPDGPDDARWLAPDQRSWLKAQLATEREQCLAQHGHSVGKALVSPIVWQLGLLGFLSISLGQYALGLWLPQIIRSFAGLSNLEVGILVALPNLAAAIGMLLVAASSDRSGERCWHVAATSFVAVIGLAGAAFAGSAAAAVAFLSLALVGLLSAHAPFWPLPSKFLTGAAAAGGIALINSLANLSGFVGPYAVGLLADASGSFRTGLLVLALAPLGGMMLVLQLRHARALAQRAV
jgi:ACS family tartrate transporter-like MFS transporter